MPPTLTENDRGVSTRNEKARAPAPLPLEGMRVLDLCQVMAGPFCCMLLGDMGADVIKGEPPGNGDQTRGAMGFKLKGNDSLGFMNLNRNKRSIALDLKNQYGREAFYELVKTADVVVENYRPGVTARLGIDYETLSEIKPGLIYASISGFGQTGPWSDRPGFDLMAQAMTGIIAITGHPGQPPVRAGVPVADLGCGLFALYAVLSAYIGKQKTGVGQYIDSSLFESALALTIWDTAQYWGTGKRPEPMVNIAVFHDREEWVAYLFPRGKHRPEVFHTGELTVSPASIDLCGIFVVPLLHDFERITGDAIAGIFLEVTLPDDQFLEVAGKLESER